MTTHTVTLHVPEPLFNQVKRRAARSNRPVEEELLDLLATTVPAAEQLPSDLEEALAELALLDEDALWRAVRSRLAAEAAAQLEQLHFKRQREGLTDAEAETLAALVRQYERAMLIRAQAALLLKQRGHDVSQPLAAE
jgi:hypothetical protein